jgi:cobalt/nickel transport system permease protein
VESPAASRRRKRKPDFVARTISGVTEAIERSVYTEEYARGDGLLQHIDPRAKVVVFVIAILTVGLSRSLPMLLALYAMTVIMAALSRLPLGFFVKRVLLGVPLFAGIVVIPALFLIHGKPLVQLNAGFVHLAISDNALLSMAIFVTRVSASVSLAILLVVTTQWADLLKALRVIRVPSVFIVVLGMTYRYIFLFLQTVENLFLARASRSVGRATESEQRRWIGSSMGTLMGKSFKTSNDVYQAMVARGFTGDVYTISDFQMRDEDWLFVSASVVLLALALIFDLGLR